MNRGQFFFITGGARSGKSRFAESLASGLEKPVTYIATAEGLDEEMVARIKEHQKRRPPSWTTIEEPLNVTALIEKIGQHDGVIIIDCLTFLITNLLFKECSEGKVNSQPHQKALAEVEKLAEAVQSCRAHVILVSNEVGLGLVPPNPQGRLFRDVAGWANQIMAAKADKVYFLVSGLAVDLKTLNQDLQKVILLIR
ncbi:MAG: bifunctional adenosylcobinamide kinase/adenosylcobinamide-phosphate guanylyltransferase [Bacillota bacterium]|jgi:adenosylcobinamide kinase/adenosylcobinamide-phosphate guanylyltransferase|nr:bifunctional adenosylcobinamide kinase/adenosylcobinamide-phosphate guanylyltransferase [Bacillota bacterium]